MSARVSRRNLLKGAGAAAAGLGLAGLGSRGDTAPALGQAPPAPSLATEPVLGMPFEARDTVRVGLIGCGRRGRSLLNDLLGIEKVQIKAVCDVVPDHAAQAQALCEKRKAPRPEAYTKSELHYEELVKRDDVDLVYIATPWRWHVRNAVAAMEAGKHAAVEVPAAVTLDECWKLVEVSERTRRHCVMLENCNYGYEEMLVARMVKAGLFGDLLHAECAYNHDLRDILFENASEGLWRRAEHVGRNGNLYPTHGLGPVAWYLGIHRGDRFDHLVSMSSPEAGLTAHRKAKVPAGDPKWQEKYDCGDVNTSLLKTAKGRTILLQHNVTNPRPYDRINLLAGTKGIFRGYPARIFFEGGKGEEHKWANLKDWKKRYEDPLWTKLKKAASKGGHGGMDYVMSWRLVDCMRRGLPPDMDVYDAAAWSAPAPLSEMSVSAGSAPVEFPDFTRGRWQGPIRGSAGRASS
jgi:predicted dehydrogenase